MIAIIDDGRWLYLQYFCHLNETRKIN